MLIGKHITGSVAETRTLGAEIAKRISVGSCVALCGTLGSGKTELVRGLVDALNEGETVRSPSFALVYTYDCRKFPVYHFDFYRLNNSSELLEIGYWDYIADKNGVCIIEWADMFPEVVPEDAIWLRFANGNSDDERIVEITTK